MNFIPKRRKPPKFNMREQPQVRCFQHLMWIRGHMCAVPGCIFVVDAFNRVQAAHVRTGTDGGTSVKPGDNWTIPLCAIHHAKQHDIGEPAFERQFSIDMKKIAAEMWERSPAGKKYRSEHPDRHLLSRSDTNPGDPT